MTSVPAGQVQFRQDLERSYQIQQGKSYLVVKDPLSRRYFRFTQAQASIIELFAETPRSTEDIAERASEKLNSTIAPSTIESFCNSLEEKLLLETPAVREKLSALRGQRLDARSSFLYWKVGSIDPVKIFDWLVPRTRWAFTPSFQLLAVFIILTGFTITYSNWQSLSGQAPALFSLYGLILIWPVIFTVTTIHEFSHGLTCRHYGG